MQQDDAKWIVDGKQYSSLFELLRQEGVEAISRCRLIGGEPFAVDPAECNVAGVIRRLKSLGLVN